MKRSLYFIFILFIYLLTISLPAEKASERASKTYKRSLKYEIKGQIDRAIETAIKAEALDPSYWRYSWHLGELYLYHKKDGEKCLKAYTDAIQKGYDRPISYHKQAHCYYEMQKYDQSIDHFLLSIEKNKIRLKNAEAENKQKEANHAKYQIGDSYSWLAHLYIKKDRYFRSYKAAKEIEKYDPDKRNLSVMLHDGISRMVYNAISYGNLKRALELCREEVKIVSRYGREPDKRIPRKTLCELIEKRIHLGKIQPVYTHNITAFYFRHLQTEYDWKNKKKSINRKMTDAEQRTSGTYMNVLTMLIESMSDGKLSLSWKSVYLSRPLTDVILNESKDEVSPVFNSHAEFIKQYKKYVDKLDTAYLIWNGPTGEAKGGSTRIAGVPPVRGFVVIHPEHSMGIWLHEFFHVIENIAGISPSHGYYKPQRKHFPAWKGETGNQTDYFWWHFQTSVKNFGYEKIRFSEAD
ncbi:MAG: hypothetical protein OEZ34_02155 [Spirochaetia bacterium]|nr:hypothetical protein [Spirochaetia bacterium]